MERSGENSQQSRQWIPTLFTAAHARMRAQGRLLALSMAVGVVAGLGAVVFYSISHVTAQIALGVLAGYTPEPHPAGEPILPSFVRVATELRPWLFLPIAAVGGLISGWLVFTFAPEAEGHGTDAVIEAYHHKQGAIRARVPAIKILASAITIGTGGSGGREGPIAQIGAGFGSFLASMLRLSAADRRILLAAGMGAGIAAIFRAPLAGALFAAEVLYWSPAFEPEVILPAGVASVVSYSTFGMFFGWRPLFAIPELRFENPWQLGPYFLLVLFIVPAASLYVRTFYQTTSLFHRWSIPRTIKPAVGAGLTALVGLAVYYGFGGNPEGLAVLSYGYQSIQQALSPGDSQTIGMLVAIALAKVLTTSLTIGSGGSGGVFGPSMVIGGCLGGAVGLLFQQWWPALVPHPASFVVVGMAGFFAAAAKTPFSTIFIVSEMTGGYHLLLPSLWVCVLAFMLSDPRSLYSAQVENQARSPAHRGAYVRHLLAGLTVGRFMNSNGAGPRLRASDSMPKVLALFRDSKYTLLPVVNESEQLLGVVSVEEALLALESPGLEQLIVAVDLMRNDVTPLVQQDRIDRALEEFAEHDVLELPVLESMATRRLVGTVRRFDITSAYIEQLHEPRVNTAGRDM